MGASKTNHLGGSQHATQELRTPHLPALLCSLQPSLTGRWWLLKCTPLWCIFPLALCPLPVPPLAVLCEPVSPPPSPPSPHSYVTDHLGQPPDEITLHCMMEVMGRVGRWADGLRFFMLAFQQLGSYRGVMQLDLTQQHWAGACVCVCVCQG